MDRLDTLRRAGIRQKSHDGFENVEWSELPRLLDHQLTAAGLLAVVLSPHLTVEEAYLLVQYVRGIDAEATLVLGQIPFQGDDERFPNGFTIRAEKCPNRRGIEAIISHFSGGLMTGVEEYLSRINTAKPGAIWFTGGYKTDWNAVVTVEAVSQVPRIIVQDCFASPLWEAATMQLPGGTFAERGGSYVNCTDRLQSFDWAIRAPVGAMVEGQLYWRLLGRKGLFKAYDVLQEIARDVPYFHAVTGQIPTVGVDLQVNQLVS